MSRQPAGDFEPEQKRYLEGFVAGLQIAKAAKSFGGMLRQRLRAAALPEPTGPDAAAFKAQDRVLASGSKLSDQEKFKREQHPFDSLRAAEGARGEGRIRRSRPTISAGDFLVCSMCAPNQNSYMCRLRIPNGIVKRNNSPASPTSPSAMAAAMRM